MPIKRFTMKEVDEEIMQIVLQQQGEGQQATSGPPNVIKSLLDKAKAKRNGGNANNQTETA